MGFTVEPAALLATGKVLTTAAHDLDGAEPTVRKAEAHASEIHFQQAAGMAEAVAQKAGASLTLVRAVLNGLNTGLNNAAGVYQKSDRLHGPR